MGEYVTVDILPYLLPFGFLSVEPWHVPLLSPEWQMVTLTPLPEPLLPLHQQPRERKRRWRA